MGDIPDSKCAITELRPGMQNTFKDNPMAREGFIVSFQLQFKQVQSDNASSRVMTQSFHSKIIGVLKIYSLFVEIFGWDNHDLI